MDQYGLTEADIESIMGTDIMSDISVMGLSQTNPQGLAAATNVSKAARSAAKDPYAALMTRASKALMGEPEGEDQGFEPDDPNVTDPDAIAASISDDSDSFDMGDNSGGFSSDASSQGMADAQSNSEGPDGDGDGGDKIVCSAMCKVYGFGEYRQKTWLKYSLLYLKPEHAKGYHFLFQPLVKFGFKSGNKWCHLTTRKMLEHIAIHRTDDLQAEMNGTKRDIIGMIERLVLEPVCYIVGKCIKKGERT